MPPGVQFRRAREESLFDFLALGICQRAVVNQDSRDIAIKKSLRKRRLRGIVRIEATADDHFVETDFGFIARARAGDHAVEKKFSSVFSGL